MYDLLLYWTKYVKGHLYSKVSGTVNPVFYEDWEETLLF